MNWLIPVTSKAALSSAETLPFGNESLSDCSFLTGTQFCPLKAQREGDPRVTGNSILGFQSSSCRGQKSCVFDHSQSRLRRNSAPWPHHRDAPQLYSSLLTYSCSSACFALYICHLCFKWAASHECPFVWLPLVKASVTLLQPSHQEPKPEGC